MIACRKIPRSAMTVVCVCVCVSLHAGLCGQKRLEQVNKLLLVLLLFDLLGSLRALSLPCPHTKASADFISIRTANSYC